VLSSFNIKVTCFLYYQLIKNFHPHLCPPPSPLKNGIFDKGEEIVSDESQKPRLLRRGASLDDFVQRSKGRSGRPRKENK